MPRKSKIDVCRLLKILIENKNSIIDEKTQEIAPPSYPCWINIQRKFDYAISVKYIYAIVKLDRYDILNKLGLKTLHILFNQNYQLILILNNTTTLIVTNIAKLQRKMKAYYHLISHYQKKSGEKSMILHQV